MIETISIQSIWNPPGKEFPKVITTPEQAKFHLYKDQEQLTQNLKVGSLVAIDCLDTTNRQGKPIRRIQNVILDGQPIISQAVAETKAQEAPKYGGDEDSYTRRSIERQVSVKLAFEISSEAEGLEAVLNKAERIYQWISKGA